MFWLCFCMLCVCLCVCLCACCETLRTCTVVCMSFYVMFFLGCDVAFLKAEQTIN